MRTSEKQAKIVVVEIDSRDVNKIIEEAARSDARGVHVNTISDQPGYVEKDKYGGYKVTFFKKEAEK